MLLVIIFIVCRLPGRQLGSLFFVVVIVRYCFIVWPLVGSLSFSVDNLILLGIIFIVCPPSSSSLFFFILLLEVVFIAPPPQLVVCSFVVVVRGCYYNLVPSWQIILYCGCFFLLEGCFIVWCPVGSFFFLLTLLGIIFMVCLLPLGILFFFFIFLLGIVFIVLRLVGIFLFFVFGGCSYNLAPVDSLFF